MTWIIRYIGIILNVNKLFFYGLDWKWMIIVRTVSVQDHVKWWADRSNCKCERLTHTHTLVMRCIYCNSLIASCCWCLAKWGTYPQCSIRVASGIRSFGPTNRTSIPFCSEVCNASAKGFKQKKGWVSEWVHGLRKLRLNGYVDWLRWRYLHAMADPISDKDVFS